MEDNALSHTATIETQCKDPDAIRAACVRLGLPAPKHGTHELYSTTETGWAVQLKDWTYPVVFNADGKVAYDNFNGRWGDTKQLDAFKQTYAVCKATAEARQRGFRVVEQRQANGSIRLVCTEIPR